MAPKNYRYYRLDGAGHLHMADWFHAESDEDATAQILAKHPDAKCEIWHGTRLVAKLEPKGFNPDDPDLQNAAGERLSATASRMRVGSVA